MIPNLRPMSLGEILDRTFQIYRSRFPLYASLAAIAAAATMGLEFASYTLWGPYPLDMLNIFAGFTFGEFASLLGFFHLSLWFQLLIWPCFVFVVSSPFSGDQSAPALSNAIGAGAQSWRGTLGLSTLLLLITLVFPEFVCAILFVGVAALMSEVMGYQEPVMSMVLVPLLLLLCIAGWAAIGWMGAMFYLAVPGKKLEGLSVREALRRGKTLSKGSRARLFAAWLMPAIFGWILYLAVTRTLPLLRSSCAEGFVFQFRFFQVATRQGLCALPSAVESIRIVSEAGISTLLGPIYPIALTLFYYDQRIRQEGFDIEWMMERAGMIGPAQSGPATAQASVPQAMQSASILVETSLPEKGESI